MQELLLAVARGLVEDKEAVKVTVDEPREDAGGWSAGCWHWYCV